MCSQEKVIEKLRFDSRVLRAKPSKHRHEFGVDNKWRNFCDWIKLLSLLCDILEEKK